MFIAESTPSTITGHADTFALILTLVIGFRFNVMEYTSIDPETNTTVTVYKKGALRFFFDGVFRFREFYRSRRELLRNVRITWGFSSRRETWHVSYFSVQAWWAKHAYQVCLLAMKAWLHPI